MSAGFDGSRLEQRAHGHEQANLSRALFLPRQIKTCAFIHSGSLFSVRQSALDAVLPVQTDINRDQGRVSAKE